MNLIKNILMGLALMSASFSLSADQVEWRNLLLYKTYNTNGVYVSQFKDLDVNTLNKQESCYKLKRYTNKKLYALYDITRNMYFITCDFI